ncbi:glycoside hydrolase [Dendrothele bispora CBS 962.96]|uniref:Beta-mannosidase A n=1 Tax=Dendrothele bispora (strain CBS 962.96) TaxID=1314807 RepID=A0A4S8M7I0_DENBC|nr:glycoside hydrolase [Dendrothele bispora CBS 962.96]
MFGSLSRLVLLPLLSSLLPCLQVVNAAIFDLSELSWTLKNENGSVVVPGSVPSMVHLDLLDAGVITEPLLEINDFTERWIWRDNWTYTADLTPFFETLSNETADSSSSQDQTLLVFYGLDTIANITFAGQPVAWVNNQFRQYFFDVTPHILSATTNGGSNDLNLTVDFESAVTYGLNVTSRPDAEFFPIGIDVFEINAGRNYIRKIPIDFGWDWSPAFAPSGIFKPAYLVTLTQSSSDTNTTSIIGAPPISPSSSTTSPDIIFIEETSIDIYKLGSNFSIPPVQSADWVVNVSLAIRSGASIPEGSASLKLEFPELGIESEEFGLPELSGKVDESSWASVQWQIPDEVPERWYPHNLGKPQLYNLTGTITIGNSNSSSSSSSSSSVTFRMRTGFRTIRLVQLPYSQEDVEQRGITPGDQYHFEVNGKAFYSKGSNLIPFDNFYSRIKTEDVRWVLESAVKVGQNIVRVWGGGVYQPSESSTAGGIYDFYSICDELGILAWTEFSFSDALSPINPFLLESVEPEVRQNVRRINRHPSVAQWAGGNEIEGIVIQTNNTLANGTIYLDQFVALFQDFLHDIALSETRSVPYTDCSTTHGVLSIEPYVLRFSNGTAGNIYGNSERFDYVADEAFNYSTYPVARFVNEFGFHSMPSFYTWQEALTSPEDFSFNSTVVASRDHHPPAGGQGQMTMAVEMWLPTPNVTSDSNQTFAQWCYSTQVFQAMTIMSEIAWYRHGAGKGENNLVLHYGYTRAYAPLSIYPFWTPGNETLEVLVISDKLEEVKGEATLTWYDWEGNSLSSKEVDFVVPPLNNSLIMQAMGLDDILPEGKEAKDVWMLLNLTAEVDGVMMTNEEYFTPTSLANASIVDPMIEIARNDDLTFTLSAKGGVAPWTWLEHPAKQRGGFNVQGTERLASSRRTRGRHRPEEISMSYLYASARPGVSGV